MDLSQYFNTVDYTVTQLALCVIGGIMWVLVYLLMILSVRKNKYVEMPIFVAVGNIVWEALWAWVFTDRIDMGSGIVFFYRAWFFLDCWIFYDVFRHGASQLHNPYLRKRFKLVMMGLVVFWTALLSTFIMSGYDHPLGVNSAYILNLGIAILYVLLFMHQHESGTFLKSIAWLKMLGSGIYTIALWNIIPPTSYFEHAAGPIVFVVDCYYIWMVYNWKKPQLDEDFHPETRNAESRWF